MFPMSGTGGTWRSGIRENTGDQLKAVLRFLAALKVMWSDSFNDHSLEVAENEFNLAHQEFEQLFPMHISAICWHLLRHMGEQIRRHGPLWQSSAMWLERGIRHARKQSRSKCRSTVSAANGCEVP